MFTESVGTSGDEVFVSGYVFKVRTESVVMLVVVARQTMLEQEQPLRLDDIAISYTSNSKDVVRISIAAARNTLPLPHRASESVA